MTGVPATHVTVDLDCAELRLPADAKRCDFLFVGESNDGAWVAPIELKSGNFSAGSVARQLQGGTDLADRWLPAKAAFTFVPVLAAGRGIRKEQRRAWARAFVRLRGQTRLPTRVPCGSRLRDVLVKP